MPLKPDMAQDLRTMVRDVLREVMAQRQQPQTGAAVEAVRIASDHDLAAFIARVIEPQTQEKLRAGKLRFTLGNAPAPASSPAALTGTPLARDKARRLGLTIERRR